MRRPKSVRRCGTLMVVLLTAAGCESHITDTRQPGSTLPEEVTALMQTAAVPISTTSPGAPFDDLSFLPVMIGDARIVALGENTHGTRDFFEMKDRILRHLVNEMGFDAFAIEASWPETNRADAFVRGGDGDVGLLLAGMYFWTWKTQAVRQMTLWMRDFNAGRGDLGFYGLDTKYPGMAIHNIEAYLASADPDVLPDFQARLACLTKAANDAYGRFAADYSALSTQARDACRSDLEWVRDELVSRQDPELIIQSARVLLQYDAIKSGTLTRDDAMAENVAWLLEQSGPDARIVVWAHNFHVGYVPDRLDENTMRRPSGDHLGNPSKLGCEVMLRTSVPSER